MSPCTMRKKAIIRRTLNHSKGVGSGVFEIVTRFDGDTYRTVYAVQIGRSLYVLHAFQKKAKTGIKTPKKEVELIQRRYRMAVELEKETRQ